jgi:hypothetical protein
MNIYTYNIVRKLKKAILHINRSEERQVFIKDRAMACLINPHGHEAGLLGSPL